MSNDIRTALLDELSKKALELKAQSDELREFALALSIDNDGEWLGDDGTDFIGHISSYVGRLEGQAENLREDLKACKAECDVLMSDLHKACALLCEALEYSGTGMNGPFKSKVREFLEVFQ